MIELKKCPFCGGEPFEWSCDRLIQIGCKKCSYQLSFHGVIQSEIDTGVPVVYEGDKVSDHEWYDQFAHEKAAEVWNRYVLSGATNSIDWGMHTIGIFQAIEEASTADVRPVVRGKWESHGEGFKWVFVCSACGYVDGHPMNDRMNFCPNCGAKMDLEKDT